MNDKGPLYQLVQASIWALALMSLASCASVNTQPVQDSQVGGSGRTPNVSVPPLDKQTESTGVGGGQETTRESAPTSAAKVCSMIDGASLFADDETYLGKLANKYSADSIYNKYGTHGSEYSSKSIWNKYNSYGSMYSTSSPWNKYSSRGPQIIKDGEIIGRLTINEHTQGAVSPVIVGVLCFDSDRGNPN